MIKIAIAGQPNCGKSTIFNMMSGVKQYVANYPGVTVEKKSTLLRYEDHEFELVDLPGTYSFSAFSKEEQAAINFLIDENPDFIINVIDASSLQRSLYLTYQLLEIGKPMLIVLNMMDVAKRRGIQINTQALADKFNVPVIEAVGAKGIGKEAMLAAISQFAAHLSASLHPNSMTSSSNYQLPYPKLEPAIQALTKRLDAELQSSISTRWLALKLIEKNLIVQEKLVQSSPRVAERIQQWEGAFGQQLVHLDINAIIATERHQAAKALCAEVLQDPVHKRTTLTSYIDKFVLNRWLSFIILGLVIFATYELSIVKGYEITNYTWPYLASVKNYIISLLPQAQFVEVPLITEFIVWLVNSAFALLNYIPIFLILFAIIAVLEDTGYMPRIAFILDRVFNRYGLHGQSTLPLVLGGAFVGGCAVPGIMATKGIADDRARIATIMTVPYMNCLAKVPFYTLLLGAFFAPSMSLMMFFISTVTFFIALSVASILTLTLLKNEETRPFIMELPAYHLPTLKGVMLRSLQRVWLYIHKVGTIVMAVAVVLFVLLQFPGISSESKVRIDEKVAVLLNNYGAAIKDSPHAQQVGDTQAIFQLINVHNQFRAERMTVASSADKVKALEVRFAQEHPELFKFIKPSTPDERLINRQIRVLAQQGQLLQNEIKNQRIENSLLGMFGRALEPITQWAGFDWRINVAFLSSFAARESAVATIGSIYETGKAERPEEAFGGETAGYTALHAVSMLIFMIFTPPCIASMVVLKLNVQSYRLMSVAIAMPFVLGLVFASTFFTLGNYLAWSGVETMGYFYCTIVSLTILLGLIKRPLSCSVSEQLSAESSAQA